MTGPRNKRDAAPAVDGVERRRAIQVELRQEENSVRVIGHAAVFNQEADIAGIFREVIAPGAFRETIQEDDVPLLIEHCDLPLARTRSGTLKLSEDNIGLRIEATLDASDPDVQRIVPKMKRGDLDKMSFAFRAEVYEWDWEEEPPLRTLKKLRLYDVSIVTMPAYEGTDIALRALADERARKANNFSAAALRVRLSKTLDLRVRSTRS